MEIPLGAPGVGTTYTIPAGNLFPRRTRTRRGPEIFGMGFRNPFRFTVDPETGWVLSADYGPDASTTNANRGPQGSVEYNVLTERRQLWLAVLHPRQHAVQRLQLRDLDVGRRSSTARTRSTTRPTTRA